MRGSWSFTTGLPFKREQASPAGGGLAKTLTEIHQIHPDIVSVNSIFSVDGYLHDTHIKFLLDSGAAISVINYNVVRDTPITPIHTRAISANGSPLDVIGETVADIILGDLTVNQKFVVVRNLTVECLLGADFLQAHGAVLDCCNHTLSIGTSSRSSIPISFSQRPTSSQSPDALNCILRAFTDIEIPGRTIQIVMGKVDATHIDGSMVLIEPISPLPDHLHVACSLGLIENGQVAIQVMNVSPSPVRVFKGMRLGVVTPEHNILLVSQQESPTEDHIMLTVLLLPYSTP